MENPNERQRLIDVIKNLKLNYDSSAITHSSDSASEPNIVLEESNNPVKFENATNCQITQKALTQSVLMALGYSFSFEVFAIGFMIPAVNPDYLPAVPLINSSIQTVSVVMAAGLYAISLIAGREFGTLVKKIEEGRSRKEIKAQGKKIRDVFRSGLLYSVLPTTLAVLALYFSKPILTNWLQQDPIISAWTSDYLGITGLGLPGLTIRMIAEQMLFAGGNVGRATIGSLVNFALGTGVSLYLAFGSPQMGLKGIAWGYAMEAWTTAITYLVMIALHPDYQPLHLFNPFEQGKRLGKTFLELLKIGLPIVLQLGSEFASSIALVTFAGWLGEDALGAQAFTSQLLSFAIIFSTAFGQFISQEESRAVGGRHYAYASRFARIGLLTSALFVLPMAIFPSIKPDWFAKIMSTPTNNRAFEIAKKILPATGASVVFDTVRYGMIQTSRPADDWIKPTIISLVLLWSGVALAYYLAFETGLGIYGIAIASLLGVGLSFPAIVPSWIKNTQPETFATVIEVANNENSEDKDHRYGFFGGNSGEEIKTQDEPAFPNFNYSLSSDQ